jgi:hypothetical protein
MIKIMTQMGFDAKWLNWIEMILNSGKILYFIKWGAWQTISL